MKHKKRATDFTLRQLLCILLCTVLFTASTGCGDNAELISTGNAVKQLPPAGERSLLTFGDSIAAGYGLETQNQNYLGIFAENIGAQLNNLAVSGYDSADFLAQLNTADATLKSAIAAADIIAVSIGGNDLLHNKDLLISTIKDAVLDSGELFPDEVTAIYSECEANIKQCISILRTLNPDAVIIIQTLYNPVLEQGYRIAIINAAKYVDKYIVRLNETIRSSCEGKADVYVFDISEKMNGDTENFYNVKEELDIHPTVHGHASLAVLYTELFNKLTGE